MADRSAVGLLIEAGNFRSVCLHFFDVISCVPSDAELRAPLHHHPCWWCGHHRLQGGPWGPALSPTPCLPAGGPWCGYHHCSHFGPSDSGTLSVPGGAGECTECLWVGSGGPLPSGWVQGYLLRGVSRDTLPRVAAHTRSRLLRGNLRRIPGGICPRGAAGWKPRGVRPRVCE